ncbi:MAG: transposase [Candidatus Aminicenantes bacterium]|nr:transposase [Candidatus Aminicenantes bacterium]
MTVPYTDRQTGAEREAQVFLATLGASSLTYAESQVSQTAADWIAGHAWMFEDFGCATEALVPDNLKSGVTSACSYEPGLHPTCQALAEHDGTAVLPTRKQAPTHKAKVEMGGGKSSSSASWRLCETASFSAWRISKRPCGRFWTSSTTGR